MSVGTTPRGLQVKRTRVAEGTLVRLAGAIDETFPHGVLSDALGVLAVDMAGIQRVTSFGIREWRRELAATPASLIYFVGVPPCAMAQFAMVADFGGPRGQIVSFVAPYRCEACGAEKARTLDRRTDPDASAPSKLAPLPCGCGASLEFDELPDMYRAALTHTAPLDVVPALFVVLAAEERAQRPFRIAKQVGDAGTLLQLSGNLDADASLRRAADGLEGEVAVSLAQLGACDEQGLAALSALLGEAVAAGCPTYVADCPPAILGSLSRLPQTLAGASLVSLCMAVRCPDCRRASIRVEVASLAGDAGFFCPRCGGACEPDGAQALRGALAALPARPSPSWLPPMLDSAAQGTPAPASGLILDRYSLIRPIGAGGMAEIFLARQVGPAGFDRPVAIKRILPAFAADHEFVRMFLAEARLAARLSHPNVVRIHELLVRDGQYYIVMEHVDGANLAQLLAAMRKRGRPMPAPVALRICAGVLAGLGAAHAARGDDGALLGIVHRDVSPQNVLVGRDGGVRLTDFGVAKAYGTIDPTNPGTIKGKIAYQAPEALTGGSVDARADLFAVGILLYECLMGVHPFRRGTDYQTYQAVLAEARPELDRHDLPARAEAVVARALARAADERYPTATAMLADVELVAQSLGSPASDVAVASWVNEVLPLALEAAAEEVAVTRSEQLPAPPARPKT